MSFDYGHRECGFVKFDKDEKTFYDDVTSLAEKAAKKITEYRKFRDIDYAKEKIIQRKNAASYSHELYHRMMICGLARDERALAFYEELLDEVKNSTLVYEMEYDKELTEEIAKVINDADKFHDYILMKVNLQREFWRGKSSMKKLKENVDFER